MIDLKNKTILIVGATSDIGFDNAVTLHELGANLILTGRNNKKLSDIRTILGNKHKYILADISNENDIAKAVEAIECGLDGVIFSIGLAKLYPARLVDESNIENIFFTNYSIPVLFTKQLLRKRKINENASLIYYTSVSYRKQFVGNAIYSSAKIALSNYVKALAIELVPNKIRCNSMAPGFVVTTQNSPISPEYKDLMMQHYPNGFTKKSDVTNAAIFLLSSMSSGITGHEIIVDGGFSISL